MCCPIVELRQYTLYARKRDTLIELFENKFIESQEAVGMQVIGQFRDVDNPDRFVWLRGFSDMDSRKQACQAFYGGPVWATHRDAANSTMIDSDNVLLLRPAQSTSGFTINPADRPPSGTTDSNQGLIIITMYSFHQPVSDDVIAFFTTTVLPLVAAYGAKILAWFVTEARANTFPALPVREGEHVIVVCTSFTNEAVYEAHLAAVTLDQDWREAVVSRLAQLAVREPEVLRLAPTARSLIRAS